MKLPLKFYALTIYMGLCKRLHYPGITEKISKLWAVYPYKSQTEIYPSLNWNLFKKLMLDAFIHAAQLFPFYFHP